jgi:hypothetical protein
MAVGEDIRGVVVYHCRYTEFGTTRSGLTDMVTGLNKRSFNTFRLIMKGGKIFKKTLSRDWSLPDEPLLCPLWVKSRRESMR